MKGATLPDWDMSILDQPHRWSFEIPPDLMDLCKRQPGTDEI
jgi:hypothetical protein